MNNYTYTVIILVYIWSVKGNVQHLIMLSMLVPAFGLAIWKLGDPDCSNPFYGYSLGMPLALGIVFISMFIVFAYERCHETKTHPMWND